MRINKHKRRKIALLCYIIAILSIFLFLVYYFDKVITPTVMIVADAEVRARSSEIINKNILEVYSKEFNYDEIIRVDKDSDGNITMLKADTVKMSAIASEVALKSQRELAEIGSVGIKLPIGYITKSNIMSYWGPKVTVRMEPIGRIETQYSSMFESAGINQTRHKIYIEVYAKAKVIIPLANNEVEVKNQIPIAETVIVGKIPRTSINLDLDSLKK
ncbi:sporulation protein YunB [Clostridium polyendosporum]|uniref:Sporulation protein YunB n=1 Tax=Clostridium polyendosporum TaxID=69208 RepID=A0A919VE10_9CLOT|nr:sporulation protein YunB [Clostridium polyendosporum]GIM28619.1 sporulation protein YunB [Clostridium polyendosporum]